MSRVDNSPLIFYIKTKTANDEIMTLAHLPSVLSYFIVGRCSSLTCIRKLLGSECESSV